MKLFPGYNEDSLYFKNPEYRKINQQYCKVGLLLNMYDMRIHRKDKQVYLLELMLKREEMIEKVFKMQMEMMQEK